MLEVKDLIINFLNEVARDIKQNQSAQGRTASGRTANSLEAEADDNTGILYGSVSVNALETGRKSGRVPAGFKDVIKQWMSDKGIFQAESDSKKNSIAYLIARKIAREGTALYRSGGNSGVLSTVLTDDRISGFESQILKRYGREIQNEVIITFGK